VLDIADAAATRVAHRRNPSFLLFILFVRLCDSLLGPASALCIHSPLVASTILMELPVTIDNWWLLAVLYGAILRAYKPLSAIQNQGEHPRARVRQNAKGDE
jgi:hypothetical protein